LRWSRTTPLLYVIVFRPLRDALPLARAVASLGVLVVVPELMACSGSETYGGMALAVTARNGPRSTTSR
jgi:hypothetical protein